MPGRSLHVRSLRISEISRSFIYHAAFDIRGDLVKVASENHKSCIIEFSNDATTLAAANRCAIQRNRFPIHSQLLAGAHDRSQNNRLPVQA